ncbi:MAG: hypothetical protein GX772_00350 [Alcaligenaceae bacterium]|nr:hypothetical protein [Alcaligenaceae bacterium]
MGKADANVVAWAESVNASNLFASVINITESSDDAYRVFRKMQGSGHPPDDWSQLLAEARAEGQRLQRFAAGISHA